MRSDAGERYENPVQMRIDQEVALSSPGRDSVLTIGVFDGVHRGHQRLIGDLIRRAVASDWAAGVVTFREHPASVLDSRFKPRYLMGLDERVRLIGQMGVDFVVPITFDRQLSRLNAGEFLARLQKHLRMRELVVGPDFALGHQREGDVKTLAALGEQMGFSLDVVDLVVDGDEAVRSTTIRNALNGGDVGRVASLLGRNFSLTGVVSRGVGRGRTLGFPTANLVVPDGMAVPGDGIYATRAQVGESAHMAATSIGTRPTFDEGGRTVEAFLLDFDGDLYDRELRLEFVGRLRDEERFESVEALKDQIRLDVDDTRTLLGAGPPPEAPTCA